MQMFVLRMPSRFPTASIEQLPLPISQFPYFLRGNCCDLTKSFDNISDLHFPLFSYLLELTSDA